MFSVDFPWHKSIDWEIDDADPPLLFFGSDAGTPLVQSATAGVAHPPETER